jgi:hypothetical protein
MNTVERAFELARSGRYSTIEHLKRRLRQEGFVAVDVHLGGKAIKNQLMALMKTARS